MPFGSNSKVTRSKSRSKHNGLGFSKAIFKSPSPIVTTRMIWQFLSCFSKYSSQTWQHEKPFLSGIDQGVSCIPNHFFRIRIKPRSHKDRPAITHQFSSKPFQSHFESVVQDWNRRNDSAWEVLLRNGRSRL